MSQLDTYLNTLLRKKEDLARLNQDLAKEQAKKIAMGHKADDHEEGQKMN